MRKQLMFVLALSAISASCLAAPPVLYAGVLQFQGYLIEGGCGLSVHEAARWGKSTALANATESNACGKGLDVRQVNFAGQSKNLTGGVPALAQLWKDGVLIIGHS